MNPTRLRSSSAASRGGFTLIELLTVIAIIGILAAIIIPTVGKVRDAARKSQCSSNLRQIGSAMQLYAAANKGLFPAIKPLTASGTSGTWVDAVFPYINSRDFTTPSQDFPNSVFLCPKASSTSLGNNTYGYNEGLPPLWNSATDDTVQKKVNMISAPSQTMAALDYDQRTFQLRNNTSKITTSAVRHDDSFNMLYVDGHIGSMRLSEFKAIFDANPGNVNYDRLFLGQ